MQIGLIGHDAANVHVAKQWLEAGHHVVGFDQHREAGMSPWRPGMARVDHFDDLAIALPPPRTLWMALPDRAETEQTYNALLPLLGKGDTVIDAGYSYYQDTLRRAHVFSRFQYRLIDVGICGTWPDTDSCCMAIGGDPSTVERLGWVFEALEPSLAHGWRRVGPEGAGHFARMIHHAMTSAMAQVAAEGFAILGRKADPALDLPQLAALWSHSDAARACLLNLATGDPARRASRASAQDGAPNEAADAKWILDEASELRVAIPLLACSLRKLLRTPSH